VNHAKQFEQHRSFLFSIAYRMLGSVMDAEDIMQEAFLRWRDASHSQAGSAMTFLSKIVTNLCIDQLRSARVRREQYVGPWLPEPIMVASSLELDNRAERLESLSTAFLLLLETLSPTERAVFLLRDVFDYDYGEIAEITGKSSVNCRQLLTRARRHMRKRRPRFEPAGQQLERLVHQFSETCFSGDMEGLLNLLSEDITLWTDGGGKVKAVLKPIRGHQDVSRFLFGMTNVLTQKKLHSTLSTVNGQTGIINYVQRRLHSVLTFEIRDDRVQSIFIVRNPDKLKAIKRNQVLRDY
jgi:RNA polymerase sigma-70 factor (ECF subfamily)